VFPKSDEEKPPLPKQNFNKKRFQNKKFYKGNKFYRPRQTKEVPMKDAEVQPPQSIPNNPEIKTDDCSKNPQIIKDSEKIPERRPKQYKKKFTPKAEAEVFEPRQNPTNSLSTKANAEEFKPNSANPSTLKSQAEDFKPTQSKLSEFIPKCTAKEFNPISPHGENFIPNKDAKEFLPNH
jgi:hypothetical protein